MDQTWLPLSLRHTLREILECGHSKPFRPYYDWATDATLRAAHQLHIEHIVELGAGTAPLTERLAMQLQGENIRLTPCDDNPDVERYNELKRRFPVTVTPRMDSVNFANLTEKWGPKTILVLSATFHHIPSKQRRQVLENLLNTADHVLIYEPIRRTFLSGIFILLSLVPGLLLPLLRFSRFGRWRRFLWCWLIPVAPLMLVWDGIISCTRQWHTSEWASAMGSTTEAHSGVSVNESLFSQTVLCNSISGLGEQ
jgi:hypothetical protein